MGEQRNLTEENAMELETVLKKMQNENPDLEYQFREQEGIETLSEQPSNKELFEKIDNLQRQIDMIFGGHVLINGLFKKIT